MLLLAGAARARDEGGAHSLWVWIEDNGALVYPAVAVVIIGLIVATLLASFRSDDMNADQKGQLKMKIMQVMRRRISGVSAEAIAAELQVDLLVAGKLLTELDTEGLIAASGKSASGPVMYRIRGSG